MNNSWKRRLKNGNVKPAEDKCSAVLHSPAYGAEIRRHTVTFSLKVTGDSAGAAVPLFQQEFCLCLALCVNLVSFGLKLRVWALQEVFVWCHCVCGKWLVNTDLELVIFNLIATGSCLSPWNYWHCATKNYGMGKKCVIYINWFMCCFRAAV